MARTCGMLKDKLAFREPMPRCWSQVSAALIVAVLAAGVSICLRGAGLEGDEVKAVPIAALFDAKMSDGR